MEVSEESCIDTQAGRAIRVLCASALIAFEQRLARIWKKAGRSGCDDATEPKASTSDGLSEIDLHAGPRGSRSRVLLRYRLDSLFSSIRCANEANQSISTRL